MASWRFINAYSASKLQLDKNEMALQSAQRAFVQNFPEVVSPTHAAEGEQWTLQAGDVGTDVS